MAKQPAPIPSQSSPWSAVAVILIGALFWGLWRMSGGRTSAAPQSPISPVLPSASPAPPPTSPAVAVTPPPAPQPTPSQPATPATPAATPPLPDNPGDVRIVYTNNLYGWIEACG